MRGDLGGNDERITMGVSFDGGDPPPFVQVQPNRRWIWDMSNRPSLFPSFLGVRYSLLGVLLRQAGGVLLSGTALVANMYPYWGGYGSARSCRCV